MTLLPHIQNQRDSFPSGLANGLDCLHSGLDALLLASFAAREFGHPGARAIRNHRRALTKGPDGAFAALDEGCGSGFILLALQLLREDIKGLGIDRIGDQVEAAKKNAESLGLEERCEWQEADVSDFSKALNAPRFDLVLFNPPYWTAGDGRPSPKAPNEEARRGRDGTLESFCMGAKRALVHQAPCYCIYPANRLAELVRVFEKTGFGLRKILAVHTKQDGAASRILVEARKDAASDLKILPSLNIYRQKVDEEKNAASVPTEEALQLCPWIR